MTRDPKSVDVSRQRLTRLLLSLTTFSLAGAIVLGAWLYREINRELSLDDLTMDHRVRLLQELDGRVPPVYRPFPISGPLLFYHMEPNTAYVDVLGDSFTTNELGFRSISARPRSPDTRRLVVVGDSWTFGPYVAASESFPAQLAGLLNSGERQWEVINLSMLGWNTDNQIAALETFLPQLSPNLILFCPTSNDIDDSFDVWDGRLAYTGFTSGAIFRYSYEYERRWREVFGKLQRVSDRMGWRGIRTQFLFLAEWRGLAPYFASETGFNAQYTVLPTEYLDDPYRLSTDVDPGRHPTPQGYALIASYAYNALIEGGQVFHPAPLELDHAVEFPGTQYDPQEVAEEFGFWSQFAAMPDLLPLDGDYMGRNGVFSVPSSESSTELVVSLDLIDEPALYPLTLTLRIASPQNEAHRVTLSKYWPSKKITLDKPKSLDRYPYVEVFVEADRVVVLPGRMLPASMRRPSFVVR